MDYSTLLGDDLDPLQLAVLRRNTGKMRRGALADQAIAQDMIGTGPARRGSFSGGVYTHGDHGALLLNPTIRNQGRRMLRKSGEALGAADDLAAQQKALIETGKALRERRLLEEDRAHEEKREDYTSNLEANRRFSEQAANDLRRSIMDEEKREFDAEQKRLDRESRQAIEEAKAKGSIDHRRIDTLTNRFSSTAQRYSDRLAKAGLPQAKVAADEANRLLAPYMEKNEDGTYKKPEIPGVGYFESTPVIGGVISASRDLYRGNTEAGDIRAATNNLLNMKIKLQSGSQVTVNELLRNRLGSGFDMFASDKNFRRGWRVMNEELDAARNNYNGGVDPDIVDYHSRREAGEDVYARDYVMRRLQGMEQTQDNVVDFSDLVKGAQ